MLNFDYLKDIPGFAPLYELCTLCEQRQNTEPESAAINARKALEWLVKAIYKMKGVEPGERASLLQLTTADVFANFIADPELMKAVHWIRKVGILAAHDGKVTRRDASFTALSLYNLVGGVLHKLQKIDVPTVNADLAWGDISEAETRRRFIDLMLREAGWDVLETEGDIQPGKACIEVEVACMPNKAGKGYAD